MDRVSVDFHIADVYPHGLNHGQDSELISKFTDVHLHGLNHGQGQS